MKANQILAILTTATAVTAAQAGLQDERGIKLMNDRLTLSPYVALSYTYDSNIDSGRHSKSGSQWSVNPGINGSYKADNWSLDGTVFYKYHAYNRYTSQLNSSSYGESLKFKWTNTDGREAGWVIQASERFTQIAQDDDMSNHNGRGIGRDRKQIDVDLAVQRRINEHLHASFLGDYYLLDYDNNVNKYASLYGWKRLALGGQLGYTLSQYIDLLLAANYQWYWQDNDRDRNAATAGDVTTRGRRVSDESKGWSVMAGIGGNPTERLSYKLLAGWSRFEYGNGTKDIDGWTYQLSGNWKLDHENLTQFSILGSSYYQPSERTYGSALKVYNLSAGVRKSFVRNKFHGTFDIAYRKETHEYTEYTGNNYDEDIWTVRFGLVYDINRLLSIYGRIEYQTEETSGGRVRGHAYDYDRWRGTVGLRLAY